MQQWPWVTAGADGSWGGRVSDPIATEAAAPATNQEVTFRGWCQRKPPNMRDMASWTLIARETGANAGAGSGPGSMTLNR